MKNEKFVLIKCALFATFTLSAPRLSLAAETIICEGSIPVHIIKNGVVKKPTLMPSKALVRIDEGEADAIRFAVKPDKPLVDVYPWGEITHKTYEASYGSSLDLAFTSDGSTYFAIATEGRKTGHRSKTICSLRFVETPVKASPLPASNPQGSKGIR